jgi:hypothetical protein
MRQTGCQANAMPDDDRPWERHGAVRRDAEPDRGLLLCVLGQAALLLALVGGALLGAVVWRLADDDIQKMRASRMHRTGRWDAEHARQFGMGAVVYAALAYATLTSMLLGQVLFGL